MGDTSIQWTDKVWNPVRGCSMAKGSETGGCLNCYAARLAARNLPELKSPTTGESFARILDSGPQWTGKVELIEKALTLPLRWRTPKRIFVNSMSDLFHEWLSDDQIDRVFAVMAMCPQHTFQVLTKRAERMLDYFHKSSGWEFRVNTVACDMQGGLSAIQMPMSNVWLGVSCENQTTADARMPLLLQTPAAKRFVSYEPALSRVDWCETFGIWWNSTTRSWIKEDKVRPDWIIVGGESGPGARPFDIEWSRTTIRTCEVAGVACFVKQLGAKPTANNGFREGPLVITDRKGGDWEEWPADLRVRQFRE